MLCVNLQFFKTSKILSCERQNYNDLRVSHDVKSIDTLSECNVNYPLVKCHIFAGRKTPNLRRDKKKSYRLCKTHFVRNFWITLHSFHLEADSRYGRSTARHGSSVESCRSWVVVVYVYTRHSANAIRDSGTARAFKCKTGRLDGDT